MRVTAVVLTTALLCGSAGAIPGLDQTPGFPKLPDIKFGDLWKGGLPKFPDFPTLPKLPAFPDLPNLSDLKAFLNKAALEKTDPPPKYDLQNTFSLPDYRVETLPKGKVPFIELIDVVKLKKWQANAEECRSKPKAPKKPLFSTQVTNANCPQYEWALPMSLESESIDAAKGLRKAWQRFEERYWWRTTTDLNNFTEVPLRCWAGLAGQGLQTPTVGGTYTVSGYPTELEGKIRSSVTPNKFALDSYGIWPEITSQDFCDDLDFDFIPMFLPGGCLYVFGVRVLCLQGSDPVTGPGVAPIWFDRGRAISRVQKDMQHAVTKYYPEYQLEAIQELLPPKRKALFMMPWNSIAPEDGELLAAITGDNISLEQYNTLATRAGDQLGGIYQPLSYPYFFQSIKRLPVLDVLELPLRSDVLKSPPGAWKFEEFKRELTASNPAYYEMFGYTSFFHAWNQLDAAILPEDNAAKPLRNLIFWAGSVDTYADFSGLHEVPLITGIPIEPYLLPFLNYRIHWSWSSVSEGYSIPQVTGSPTLDYRDLIK